MGKEATHLDCDVLIVGAGSAGLEAYKAASRAGAFCILVEQGPLGTTAQRSADIPVTLLLEAGRTCQEIKKAGAFGINVQGQLKLDTSQVLNSLRAVRARSTADVLSFIYQIPENQRLIGKARFLDSNRVAVNDEYTVSFKCAVIATGSAPVVPFAMSRLGNILTSQDLFEQDRLPSSVAIFGSGLVGVSLGQALSDLGVEVTVFGNGRIWQLTDEQVTAVARELLQDSFSFEVNAEITAIEKTPSGYGIYYLDESHYENYLSASTVLSAVGRRPRLEGLNLREIGMELNQDGGIAVNFRTMQTSVPHIFAAGDVAQTSMSTVRARREGALAGLNAARFPQLKEENGLLPMTLTLTSPGLAVVGLSFEEMKQRARQGHHFVASEVRLNEGRYRVLHREGGIMRLYCDEETHLPLGAEICADKAEHLAHFLNLAFTQQLTAEELSSFAFYHPCPEEAIARVSAAAVRTLCRQEQSSYASTKNAGAGFL